jgi:RsiW-degrading membrane proteinase PrsW (M82 family)
MVLVISYQSQKTGVSAKTFPVKTAILGLIILVPLFFLLIIAAQLLQESLGHVSASLLCGGIFSVIVYLLSLVERRWYDKINVEEVQ